MFLITKDKSILYIRYHFHIENVFILMIDFVENIQYIVFIHNSLYSKWKEKIKPLKELSFSESKCSWGNKLMTRKLFIFFLKSFQNIRYLVLFFPKFSHHMYYFQWMLANRLNHAKHKKEKHIFGTEKKIGSDNSQFIWVQSNLCLRIWKIDASLQFILIKEISFKALK